MPTHARQAVLAATLAIGSVLPFPSSASGAARSYNACTLLTLAEIRKIGGTAAAGANLSGIKPELEQLGNRGTYCAVGLVDIQLDVITAAGFDSFRKAAAKTAKFTKLAGAGDEAYTFEEKRGSSSNVGVLLRKGKHTLTLGLTTLKSTEIAAARTSLTALAKAAAAKL